MRQGLLRAISLAALVLLLLTASAHATPATKQPAGGAETVYITNTGKKYHRAGCQHLKHSAVEVTLAQAKNKGLGPCSRCRPPE